MSCDPAFLSRAGQGHYLFGVWPPDDIPTQAWDTVDKFLYCGGGGEEYPRHLPRPGGIDRQDAWEMEAFRVLHSAAGQVRSARFKSWRVSKGMVD